jgi:hypothetical protein
MPYSYPFGTSSYYYDYPAGYYRASAGMGDLLGGINIDTTKLLKTGVLAAAMWFLFPKEKGLAKPLKIAAISAGTYFLY